MSIKEISQKIKPFFNITTFLLILAIFYSLGRYSALEEKRPMVRLVESNMANQENTTKTKKEEIQPNLTAVAEIKPVEQFVSNTESRAVIGSKSGKKYYYPWCGGLKRVKPENQVKFANINDARASGYSPAGNCKGLK